MKTLDELRGKSEGQDIEYKLCRHELSKDLWETVSAFSNEGGGVLAGQKPAKPDINPTQFRQADKGGDGNIRHLQNVFHSQNSRGILGTQVGPVGYRRCSGHTRKAPPKRFGEDSEKSSERILLVMRKTGRHLSCPLGCHFRIGANWPCNALKTYELSCRCDYA